MSDVRMGLSQGPDPQRARAKLFGVGSAGCNMIEGAKYPTVALSASSADLARSHAERKVLVGLDRLVGLSGAGPDMLMQMQSVVGHELFDVFNNTELAFMMCGLGGVTGSTGVRMLCSIAKAKGAAGIVLAATPFSAESHRRRELSESAIAGLLGTATLCVEFDNDKLSSLAPNLPISRAFGLLDGIMLRPVMDLCATVSRTDLSLFREVIGTAAYGRFGLGLGRGDDRVERAVGEALSSPWFDIDLSKAKAAVAVYSSSDPWDKEVDRVLSGLEAKLPGARILWGSYSDPSLNDRIRLSLVACWDAEGRR